MLLEAFGNLIIIGSDVVIEKKTNDKRIVVALHVIGDINANLNAINAARERITKALEISLGIES